MDYLLPEYLAIMDCELLYQMLVKYELFNTDDQWITKDN